MDLIKRKSWLFKFFFQDLFNQTLRVLTFFKIPNIYVKLKPGSNQNSWIGLRKKNSKTSSNQNRGFLGFFKNLPNRTFMDFYEHFTVLLKWKPYIKKKKCRLPKKIKENKRNQFNFSRQFFFSRKMVFYQKFESLWIRNWIKK